VDSPTAPLAPQAARIDGSKLDVVKAAFRIASTEGFDAGLETLLACAHAECEFHPYGRPGALHGLDEIRSHYRGVAAGGTRMAIRASTFSEEGDTVTVDGSLRVTRPGGSLAESQVRWVYRFEDGLLREVRHGPRGATPA
jgi:ketosteroid isomerase-like protein